MKEMVLKADVDNLYKVLDFIEQELESKNCATKAKTQILVAAEEIFVNIARYAYEGGDGEAKVQVSFIANLNVIVIIFIDSGVKYDPVAKKDPNTE